eukprot:TRINITY_DN40452_c0_g1_i1.p1 TRINITY_DN40452_c0_g1~~TRINITY_DN40452_c0_g1_i1.p1  ORF type:complete len:505 (+),score=106.77 TRINITY_DN40452_c0_g1_i1:64-1578(+)
MDKYQRLKSIGKGAFGEAFLVKSKADGQLYVSKEINLAALNKKDRDATETEIRVLASVEHPNITRYIESFQEGGTLSIVLEYADGGDLHERIKRQQMAGARGAGAGVGFPENVVRNWFVQICLAMQHLHSRKILHRDLKTRNVFLMANGQIKLGDFGLSTVLNNTMALANTLCGTPYYFSPELCRNKPYNSKSDVWALGCIVYELCTLQHAFEAKNMKMLMQKIVKGTYPPIPACYSQELGDVIRWMLTKDETKRPSITQLLELPMMQLALQTLVRNLSQKSSEEEERDIAARQQAADLMAAASNAIQGHKEPAQAQAPAVSPEDMAKQLKDLKGMNRGALKDFLKGPPPEEVERALKEMQVKKTVPKLPGAAKMASADVPTVPPPVDGPKVDEVTKDGYAVMHLPGTQYATLTQQIDRLMVKAEGARSAAAADEHDVADATKVDISGLRRALIEELGEAKFQEVYALLKGGEEDAAPVEAALGPGHEDVIDRLAQLVHFEHEE